MNLASLAKVNRQALLAPLVGAPAFCKTLQYGSMHDYDREADIPALHPQS
jgi:hypothetical protein